MIRRKAAADQASKVANARPASTRAAGAGGSSSTMLRLYTDESPGLKVDPFVVMVLSIGFIISVVALHSKLIHNIVSSLIANIVHSHCEIDEAILFVVSKC